MYSEKRKRSLRSNARRLYKQNGSMEKVSKLMKISYGLTREFCSDLVPRYTNNTSTRLWRNKQLQRRICAHYKKHRNIFKLTAELDCGRHFTERVLLANKTGYKKKVYRQA